MLTRTRLNESKCPMHWSEMTLINKTLQSSFFFTSRGSWVVGKRKSHTRFQDFFFFFFLVYRSRNFLSTNEKKKKKLLLHSGSSFFTCAAFFDSFFSCFFNRPECWQSVSQHPDCWHPTCCQFLTYAVEWVIGFGKKRGHKTSLRGQICVCNFWSILCFANFTSQCLATITAWDD